MLSELVSRPKLTALEGDRLHARVVLVSPRAKLGLRLAHGVHRTEEHAPGTIDGAIGRPGTKRHGRHGGYGILGGVAEG
jgi:hypothetical protein